MLFVNDACEGHTWDSHYYIAQGNFICRRMLQAENSSIKITLCIQYLNGHPLCLSLHQANHWVYAPTNVCIHFEETLI